MKLYNQSSNRTCVHEYDGKIYRIEPQSLAEIPEHVASQILTAWPDVRNDGPAKVNISSVPWETKCGPQWELAKKEFNINLGAPKSTVGPSTELMDKDKDLDPIPADAINTETGAIDPKKLNVHLCTYCQREFTKRGFLNNHLKSEHNV